MKNFFKEILTNALILTPLYLVTAGVFYMAVTHSSLPENSFNLICLIMFVLMFPLMAQYVIRLVCIPLFSLFEKFPKPTGMAAWTPSVSVLIPAWNEEVGILKTIKSVLNTQYPKLQIVVINDGSTDVSVHGVAIGCIKSKKDPASYFENKI